MFIHLHTTNTFIHLWTRGVALSRAQLGIMKFKGQNIGRTRRSRWMRFKINFIIRISSGNAAPLISRLCTMNNLRTYTRWPCIYIDIIWQSVNNTRALGQDAHDKRAVILGMVITKGVGVQPQARPDNCAVRGSSSPLRIDIAYNSPNYYFRLLPRCLWYIMRGRVTARDKSHSILIDHSRWLAPTYLPRQSTIVLHTPDT